MKRLNNNQIFLCLFVLSFLIVRSVGAAGLNNKLSGRILLQVESHGEAWYVNPVDGKRYYMVDGQAAYSMMRNFGVGINNKNLQKMQNDQNYAKKYRGKIFLQVENHGEAYYVGNDGQMYYLKDGEVAYKIMRQLGLGIKNSDLEKIVDAAGDKSDTIFYPVESVVDGDTIKINKDNQAVTLRLIGINSPEISSGKKECYGKEATDYLKKFLEGKSVRITSDKTQDDQDIYNRFLRYVWLSDGTFVNKQMILEGYAYEYTYAKAYQYQSDFKLAQTKAQSSSQGLWSACNDESLASVDKTSGKYYTSSYYSAKYYYPEECTAWKNLSSSYLKSFLILSELLDTFPNREISPECSN